jgi:hypothetical protein
VVAARVRRALVMLPAAQQRVMLQALAQRRAVLEPAMRRPVRARWAVPVRPAMLQAVWRRLAVADSRAMQWAARPEHLGRQIPKWRILRLASAPTMEASPTK